MTLTTALCLADDPVGWFGRFLLAKGLSGATVRAYLPPVRRWLTWVEAGREDDDGLLRFVATRRDTLAPASLRLELAALRAWYGWRKFAAPGGWQPARWPKVKRAPVRVVRALTDGEVGMLLAQPDLTTFTGLRDHFIMATLYQCGLRAGELVQLELGSVRLDGLLYVRGKGGRDRLQPFGAAWHGLLEGYLRARTTTRPGKRAALFVTRHGKPLRNARSVWVIVNRYARKALGLGCGYGRLEKHLGTRPWQGHYPHLLRASFATELHRRGVDMLRVAQLMGHADPATTALYVGVDMRELRVAVGHHPRAHRLENLATPASVDGVGENT